MDERTDRQMDRQTDRRMDGQGDYNRTPPTSSGGALIRFDVLSESSASARQRTHMKYQALFSSKDISKKLKCCLLQFLLGALRVKCSYCSWWPSQNIAHRNHSHKF